MSEQITQPVPSKNPPTEGERLLLSSLADFWSLIEPLLIAARARTVCEVGIGRAEFTTLLLEFCRTNTCHYTGIDTAVDKALNRDANNSFAQFFQDHSLAVLRSFPPQDVYFIDGDHNYYTVINELRLAIKTPDRWPLIFLHDVGWPWGRRDHYCHPDYIPAEFRHPHSSSLGAIPGRNELGTGGFSGDASNYSYAAAKHEGGPCNGVLTAVEDFIQEQPRGEWQLVTVPAIFGVGILYAPSGVQASLREKLVHLELAMAPLRGLIELIERNRLDLFFAYDRTVKEFGKLLDHSHALQYSYDGLRQHSDALLKSYNELRAAAFPKS